MRGFGSPIYVSCSCWWSSHCGKRRCGTSPFRSRSFLRPPVAVTLYRGVASLVYIHNLLSTLLETLLGFVTGTKLAFILGRVVALSRRVEYYVYPLSSCSSRCRKRPGALHSGVIWPGVYFESSERTHRFLSSDGEYHRRPAFGRRGSAATPSVHPPPRISATSALRAVHLRPPFWGGSKTGQIVCYKHRTYHVSPTGLICRPWGCCSIKLFSRCGIACFFGMHRSRPQARN